MMRVTQQTMYTSMVNDMNKTLSAYMESNMQSSTQKQINRPSDDPAGIAHVLSYRSSLERSSLYEENAETALSWLNQADEVLNLVSTTIINIKAKAEQAATSTYDADQRAAIGEEIYELMQTLINTSNTEFEGKHIFAGQSYTDAAYREGLGVTSLNLDGSVPTPAMQVTGSLDYSALVRFPDQDTPPSGNSFTIPPPAGETVTYEYTLDAGETWQTGTISAPLNPGDEIFFDVGDARITMPAGSSATIKPYDAAEDQGEDNGTNLIIRPTAIYQGYDDQSVVRVDTYGTEEMPTFTTSVTGGVDADVLVRFNEAVDPNNPNVPFSYSYSSDGGATWIEGKAEFITDGTQTTARLVVPGGFMDIDAPAGSATIPEGGQYILRPQRADIAFEISPGDYIDVNHVGKDIFGGLFSTNGTDDLEAMFGEGEGKNLFETIGRLVGYCQTNNQTGVSRCLDELTEAHTSVLTYQAGVGGKENRLEVTVQFHAVDAYNQSSELSAIEDVDFAELMIRLTQQQTAYQSVLRSSSMIMQLNLTQFI